MVWMSSTTRSRILTRISKLETRLESAYDALASMAESDIREYRLDTGEGSQKTEYKTTKEIADLIEWLERTIEGLRNRLNGSGLCTLSLRRKGF